jgi:hypothetical protein
MFNARNIEGAFHLSYNVAYSSDSLLLSFLFYLYSSLTSTEARTAMFCRFLEVRNKGKIMVLWILKRILTYVNNEIKSTL